MGPFSDLPATMGQTAITSLTAGAQDFADSADGQDWANADQRIAGADEDAVRVADRFEYAGRGFRVFHAVEVNVLDDGLGARFTRYS